MVSRGFFCCNLETAMGLTEPYFLPTEIGRRSVYVFFAVLSFSQEREIAVTALERLWMLVREDDRFMTVCMLLYRFSLAGLTFWIGLGSSLAIGVRDFERLIGVEITDQDLPWLDFDITANSLELGVKQAFCYPFQARLLLMIMGGSGSQESLGSMLPLSRSTLIQLSCWSLMRMSSTLQSSSQRSFALWIVA